MVLCRSFRAAPNLNTWI
uniref:F-box protein FBW2 n=1 Tax=Rhizophora mucronata TaxID=61149 RepID=A0A2P2JGP6_RHIMU